MIERKQFRSGREPVRRLRRERGQPRTPLGGGASLTHHLFDFKKAGGLAGVPPAGHGAGPISSAARTGHSKSAYSNDGIVRVTAPCLGLVIVLMAKFETARAARLASMLAELSGRVGASGLTLSVRSSFVLRSSVVRRERTRNLLPRTALFPTARTALASKPSSRRSPNSRAFKKRGNPPPTS